MLNGPTPACRDKMVRLRAGTFSFHPDFWYGLRDYDFQLFCLIELVKPFDLIFIGQYYCTTLQIHHLFQPDFNSLSFPAGEKGIKGQQNAQRC